MTIDRTHPSGLPPDPSEPVDRPTFTREELESVEFADADLDAEEAKGDTELRKLGFTDAEISRVRGRPVEAVAPAPTRSAADVDRELDEIREMRKASRQKYWSPDVQAREAELYAEQEQLKAARAAPAKDAAEQTEEASLDGLSEALRKEWTRSGPDGLEDALKAARFRATMAFDDLADAGEALRDSFDLDLDADAQDAVASGLANDQEYKATATPAEVEEFVALPHGADLAKEWGPDAPRLLGRARREADNIMARLTEQSKIKMHHWIAGRSAAELKGMVRALAARSRRRL